MTRERWANVILGAEYREGEHPKWALEAADRVLAALRHHEPSEGFDRVTCSCGRDFSRFLGAPILSTQCPTCDYIDLCVRREWIVRSGNVATIKYDLAQRAVSKPLRSAPDG